MDIRLKKIMIRNWKKIDSLEIVLDGKNANIYGYNETGKTTVYDAFLWLLFGKDSQGQTNFDIKPTIDGQVQHNLQSIVSAIISVDGRDVELTKMFAEKWTKKHGNEAPEFDGHETSCWFNEEPVKISDYQAKISRIVDEKIFRKITNADAFLSMKIQDMRASLVEMAGDVDPMVIAGSDQTLINLVTLMLQKQLTVDALIKISKQAIRQYNDEIDGIPARIDEVKRAMPPYQDFDAVRRKIADKTKEHAEITAALSSGNGLGRQQQLDELYAKRRAIQDKLAKAAMDAIKEKNEAISALQSSLLSEQLAGQRAQERLKNIPTEESLMAEVESHRAKYLDYKAQLESAKSYNTFVGLSKDDVTCPTCGQEFPTEKVEELNKAALGKFEAEHQNNLKRLVDLINGEVKLATSIKANIEKANVDREEQEKAYTVADNNSLLLAKEIEKLTEIKKALVEASDSPVENDPMVQEIDRNILVLQQSDRSEERNAEALARLDELTKEIDSLKETMTHTERIITGNERIAELQERNRELSNMTAKQEKIKDACERFMRLKAEALTDGINSLFTYITFQLFDQQINGGIVDDCEPMINGIPYSTNSSRSQKIRAGMDIINAFQKWSGIKGPVFIDNSEAANWLLPMDCQLIRLIVSESDKKLRVELLDQ